jgi:hypothetical protein
MGQGDTAQDRTRAAAEELAAGEVGDALMRMVTRTTVWQTERDRR